MWRVWAWLLVLRRRWQCSHLWAASEQPQIWRGAGDHLWQPGPPVSTWWTGLARLRLVTSSRVSEAAFQYSDQHTGPATSARSWPGYGDQLSWCQYYWRNEIYMFIFILLYRQVPSKHLDLLKLPRSEAEASDDSKGVSETNIWSRRMIFILVVLDEIIVFSVVRVITAGFFWYSW